MSPHRPVSSPSNSVSTAADVSTLQDTPSIQIEQTIPLETLVQWHTQGFIEFDDQARTDKYANHSLEVDSILPKEDPAFTVTTQASSH